MKYFATFTFLVFAAGLISSCECKCDKIFISRVTDAEKLEIVDIHNYYRNLVSEGKVPRQPKGFNLKTIKYDEQLGMAAQRIANTCEFGYQYVTDDHRWRWVGQNLYGWSSTGYSIQANWTSAVTAWYNEYPKFKFRPISSNLLAGHYTQLVWADTEYVGCGYISYVVEQEGFLWYHKHYVCNYGPGGNIVGQRPYVKRRVRNDEDNFMF